MLCQDMECKLQSQAISKITPSYHTVDNTVHIADFIINYSSTIFFEKHIMRV